MRILLVPILVAALATSASAANFSYTYAGIDLGKVTLDDDIDFAGERYEEFGAVSLNGGFQFTDNFALSLIGSAIGNDGPNTEITATSIALLANFPFAVTPAIDIVPAVGLATFESEFCIGNFCFKDDDDGVAYGVAVRAWAVPKRLELNASFEDTTIDGSERAIGIGLALWFARRNSIRLNYVDQDSAALYSLGYRFSWR